MKNLFIKYWSLLIVGSATIIFCLAAIMQNIFNMELKDSLSLIIAFIGIFTTFGGAYLGAKISGDNAINLAKRQTIMEDLKVHSKGNRKILQEMNENLTDILEEVNSYEGINSIEEFFKQKEKIEKLNSQLLLILLKKNVSHSIYYPLEIYRISVNNCAIIYNEIHEHINNMYIRIIDDDINKQMKNKIKGRDYKNSYNHDLSSVNAEDFKKKGIKYSIYKLTNKDEVEEYIAKDPKLYEFYKNEKKLNKKGYTGPRSIKIDRKFEEYGKYEKDICIINHPNMEEMKNYILQQKRELKKAHIKIKEQYKKIIFKNEKDLDEYIFEYYNFKNL